MTGYSALNKLLGREVYTSQDQLGGPQVLLLYCVNICCN
jgi:acetyl-CoA carboxylase / biotin carboxylase 1